MTRTEQQRDVVPIPSPVCPLDTGTTLRDVAAVFFRRKRMILAVFLSVVAGVSAGAALLRPYLSPPKYVSSLKLILKKDRFDAVVTPSDRSVPGIVTTVSPQEVQSETELLKSADVLERLSQQCGVPLDRLQRDVVAEPITSGRNTTNLIGVRYSATDPAEVLRVLRELPEVYVEKYLSINRQPGALEYFRSQVQVFEQQLREVEGNLAQFDKRQPAWASEGSQPQARHKLADIEKQAAETEATIRDAESRAAELGRQLATLPETTTITRVREESPHLIRLAGELLDLESRRARATFYRDIQQLDARIEDVRHSVAAETPLGGRRIEEAVPNPMRSPLESELLRTRVQLSGLHARQLSLAGQQRICREQWAAARLIASENAVESADLRRKLKAAEESLLFYRKKYADVREANLLDQNRVLNVALAEGPRAPVKLEKRSFAFVFVVALLFALAGAAAAGLGAELLDHSIHTPRRLETCSSLPVLACLPESQRG